MNSKPDPKGPGHLLCFGLGYCAEYAGALLLKRGWRVTGTSRTQEKRDQLEAKGFSTVVFDGDGATKVSEFLLKEGVTHIMTSVPPARDTGDDPIVGAYGGEILKAIEAPECSVRWIGYLGSTGVYGDKQGDWVDEDSECAPTGPRGQYRLKCETAWATLGESISKDSRAVVRVFRLAGIYGPGRNPMVRLMRGQSRRIVKPGLVFSRTHVDDIATVVFASMREAVASASASESPPRPRPRVRVYNVCDDEPAPAQDVVLHCATLLGVEPPPEIPFDDAKKEMSPMALSFYRDSKKVRNDRMKGELGVQLKYPTYREGLASLVDEAKQASL